MRTYFQSRHGSIRTLTQALVPLLLALSGGCTMPAAAPSMTDTALLTMNQQFCTDEINRYRASVGQPPLTRSPSLEEFATQAAAHDAGAGIPHSLFSLTNGGGVAKAETELLRWPSRGVQDVIKKGLATMWAAGPDGEHYKVLVGAFSSVGCGIFVQGSEVSVTQDYH